jgi:hypothetical protein
VTRILLHYVLPLVLPAVLYLGWVMVVRRRGQTVEESLAALRQGPWFWLALAGFVLMAAGLAVFGLTSGSRPDADYAPPRYEDGKVVPGGFGKDRK